MCEDKPRAVGRLTGHSLQSIDVRANAQLPLGVLAAQPLLEDRSDRSAIEQGLFKLGASTSVDHAIRTARRDVVIRPT